MLACINGEKQIIRCSFIPRIFPESLRLFAVFSRPVESHCGARENIFAGPQAFSQGPSVKNFFYFFSKWYRRTLYFWPTGPPNVAGPGVAYPLPHLLDGPGVSYGVKI